MATSTEDVTSVRVALRVRPLQPRELAQHTEEIIGYVPSEPQVILGQHRAFTYDYVFSQQTKQADILTKCVKPLVETFFEGYNATVLAYGQTGSGKTFTMGSGHAVANEDDVGVIPRVVRMMFQMMDGKPEMEYKTTVAFLEIHNENILDLFNPEASSKVGSLNVREDPDGSICVAGLTELPVQSAADMLRALERGSISRTTASTQMNSESSRSHAIFTITVDQSPKDPAAEGQRMRSKFHFVDLAGSERIKRTQAVGARLKEGISINGGLLALGNVISALGDESRRARHVPYRDSKLTRLLQDSLGGNSRTLMIACVSPADINFEETLNTLRYADRARNIKNKPIQNVDLSTAQIAQLQTHIARLQEELAKRTDGGSSETVRALQEKIDRLQLENNFVNSAYERMQSKVAELNSAIVRLQAERDAALIKVEEVTGKPFIVESNNENNANAANGVGIISGYLTQIQELQEKLRNANARQRVMDAEATESRPKASRPATAPVSAEGALDAEDVDEDDEDDGEGDDEDSADDDAADAEGVTLEKMQNDGKQRDHEFEINQLKMDKQLSTISDEITMKEELLTQLLKTQKQMNSMKQEYESRLQTLELEVKAVETERDKILASLSEVTNNAEGTQLRRQYESKLKALTTQLTQLKQEQKEHARLLKIKAEADARFALIQRQIEEMKKNKVALVKKMKEEAKHHQEWKMEQARKLAQFVAKSRRDKITIQNQRQKIQQQDAVLKRRGEEVQLAKKQFKLMADKQAAAAAMRAKRKSPPRRAAWGARNKANEPAPETPELDQRYWKERSKELRGWLREQIEYHVGLAAAREELESFYVKRDELQAELERVAAEKQALERGGAVEVVDENDDENVTPQARVQLLNDQADTLQEELKFLHVKIVEAQGRLVVEKQKEGENDLGETVTKRINNAGLNESHALFVQLFKIAVTLKDIDGKKDRKVKSLTAEMAAKEDALASVTLAASQQDRKLVELQKEHEARVLFFLEKINGQTLSDEKEEQPHSPSDAAGEVTKLKQKIGKYESLLKCKEEQIAIITSNAEAYSESNAMMEGTINELLATGQARREVLAKFQSENGKLKAQIEGMVSSYNYHQRVCLAKGLNASTLINESQINFGSPMVAVNSSVVETASLTSTQPTLEAFLDANNENAAPNSVLEKLEKTERKRTSQGEAGVLKPKNESVTPETAVFTRLTQASSFPLRAKQTAMDGKAKLQKRGSRPESADTGKVAATGVCVQSVTAHEGIILTVAAAPDGHHLYSAGQDKSVRIWDVTESGLVGIDGLAGHQGFIRSVVVDEQLGLLFSGSADKTIRIWDLNTRKQVSVISNPVEVSSLAVLGNRFYAGLSNSETRVFDLRYMEQPKFPVERAIRGQTGVILSLALSPADNFLVTGSRAHTVGVHDLDSAQWDQTLTDHFDSVNAVCVVDSTVFSGSRDRSVRKWDSIRDFRNTTPVPTLSAIRHNDGVEALHYAHGALYSASRDGIVHVWEPGALEVKGSISNAHSKPIHGMTSVGPLLVTASADRCIKLWNPDCVEPPLAVEDV